MAAFLSACKQIGIADTRENAWSLFIDTVRRNLKVNSPVAPVGPCLLLRCSLSTLHNEKRYCF